MKTVIVLGSSGMLGQTLFRTLGRVPGLKVWGTSRGNSGKPNVVPFDVAGGIPGLETVLQQTGDCDYFVNCIAVLKSNIDESNAESSQNATIVNAFFPHELSLVAKKCNAQVIHVSTDGVFAGTDQKPYLESHVADANDLYGKTKLMGEVIADWFVTVRCSLIGFDSGKHRGLLEWFLAQPEGAELSGYTDQLWNGVTTFQFAQLCAKLILGDEFSRLRKESPIHHFIPNETVSKYQLLELFRAAFKKNLLVRAMESPSGPTRRVLGSRYRTLQDIYGKGHSLETALSELMMEYPERLK